MNVGLRCVLPPDEVKFLRQHLQLSSKALIERIHICRQTLAAWECGQKPMSLQHDCILRGLHCSAQLPAGVVPSRTISSKRAGRVQVADKTPPRLEPFIIAAELNGLRKTAIHA